ncbi:MAG: Hpt domain-containing protein [Chitinophagaceae bacterium]|nr:Hpt domain-containing protein [Oligoflexus sp.]
MPNLVVDWPGLAENFDNDKFAISLVVEAFLEAIPEGMAKLKASIVARDAKALAMAAHSLKGAILNFGAVEAVRLGQELENCGYAGTIDGVETLLNAFEEAVEVLIHELQSETARYQEAG